MDILGVLDFAGVVARPDRGGRKTADISYFSLLFLMLRVPAAFLSARRWCGCPRFTQF